MARAGTRKADSAPLQNASRLECTVLAALVRETNPVERSRAIRQLADHPWSHPDHSVLFEIIAGAPQHQWRELLNSLPAILTRKGFPDVDCERILRLALFDANTADAIRALFFGALPADQRKGRSAER